MFNINKLSALWLNLFAIYILLQLIYEKNSWKLRKYEVVIISNTLQIYRNPHVEMLNSQLQILFFVATRVLWVWESCIIGFATVATVNALYQLWVVIHGWEWDYHSFNWGGWVTDLYSTLIKQGNRNSTCVHDFPIKTSICLGDQLPRLITGIIWISDLRW